MTDLGLEGGGPGHLEDEAGGSGEDNLAVTSIIVAASVVAVCTSILVLVVIYQKCVDRVKAANHGSSKTRQYRSRMPRQTVKATV